MVTPVSQRVPQRFGSKWPRLRANYRRCEHLSTILAVPSDAFSSPSGTFRPRPEHATTDLTSACKSSHVSTHRPLPLPSSQACVGEFRIQQMLHSIFASVRDGSKRSGHPPSLWSPSMCTSLPKLQCAVINPPFYSFFPGLQS